MIYGNVGFKEIYDAEQSNKWIKLAADQMDMKALFYQAANYLQGETVKTNYSLGVRYLILSAELGNPDAQLIVARNYYKGGCFYKSIDKTLKWYNYLANIHHPKALYYLGMMYLKGNHLKKDYKRALQLLTTAAEYGSVEALRRLKKLMPI
jgi:TPR repeat protein